MSGNPTNSLFKKVFEPAVASTVRNYSSPKANKKGCFSSLLSSKSRNEIVFQQPANQDFAHFVTSSFVSIGCTRDCRYVLNETDFHPRRVHHEVVLGSQTAASELSPPFWGWLRWLQPRAEIQGKGFMRKCFIFVAAAGLLLMACFPTEAQIPATQLALEQTPPDLTMVLFPAPRVWLSLVPLPIHLFAKPFPRPAFLLDAVYKPDPSLENRLPIESFRTPFLTESSFPVAHLWRGLKLVLFESTIHPRGLELGSPTSGICFYYLPPSINDQAGVANSVGFSGISLRYSFGRDAERGKPVQIWRCVSWVTGNGRGCRF